MTTKGMIAALLAVIAIGGVIYFSLPKDKGIDVTPTGTTSETPSATAPTKQDPTTTSSNDAIVDYIVDDLTTDETKAAEATIDASVPPSQENVAGSVKTDF
ncbi:MAG: hypothetical protein KBC21_04330 [Candidatus Pacebacteria bacterium]|nr:hypothetical protein [Candidatus Paceibacterota bacterium]